LAFYSIPAVRAAPRRGHSPLSAFVQPVPLRSANSSTHVYHQYLWCIPGVDIITRDIFFTPTRPPLQHMSHSESLPSSKATTTGRQPILQASFMHVPSGPLPSRHPSFRDGVCNGANTATKPTKGGTLTASIRITVTGSFTASSSRTTSNDFQ
jgi:hypothetical protein